MKPNYIELSANSALSYLQPLCLTDVPQYLYVLPKQWQPFSSVHPFLHTGRTKQEYVFTTQD